MSKRFLIVVILLLTGCAHQQQVRYWKADDIVNTGSSQVTLSHDAGTAGTVSSERVRRVMSVKDRISKASGQNARLMISEGSEPNASAEWTANGPIVAVNLGMLELIGDDDDALAAIIGHELAHLSMNHSGRRQERETMRQGFSHVLGTLLGFVGVPMGGAIASVTTTAIATVYSRDDEREADRVGVGYMKRAGFDPQGAVRVWQKMSAQRGFSIPFLSSHPTSEERLETMRKLAVQ